MNGTSTVESSWGTSLHPWHWLRDLLEAARDRLRARLRLLLSALLVGCICGLGAVLFTGASQMVVHVALHKVIGYSGEPSASWLPLVEQPFRPWLFLLVPVVGALVTGLLVARVAPEAAGGGTNDVVAAYHHHAEVRARVPLIKILASAVVVGSGGSGGKEGPIAQVGAGIGSLLGRLLHLNMEERRILLAAGMGAGVSAIFRAPLAGAIFASEILYCSPQFEMEVIIPAALASVASYCTFGAFFGWATLFPIPELTFSNPWELGPHMLLAFWLVLLAMLYTRTYHGCAQLFRHAAIPSGLKPAVGAFLSAVIGLGLYYLLGQEERILNVFSFGTGVLKEGFAQEAGLSLSLAWVFLVIALGKLVTTSLTIGSGGAGGLFGPSLIIGGCGGGALAVFLNQMWPGLVPQPATFIVLGMAGCFSAAARTPFSTLIMVAELTGGYDLILPGLWVCSLTFLFADRQPIYQAQALVPASNAL